METSSEAGVLQKLLDRLCQETDPGKIYKTLKKMSSLPSLCDCLAEIGFRKTIKSLKKQQLLVPFVKDLVAQWSTGFLHGPQPEQTRQDFGLEKGLTTEGRSTSPEEKPQEQASQEVRRDGREVFLGLCSCCPGSSSCLSQSRKSHQRSNRRAPHIRSPHPGENWSPELQQDVQNLVHLGTSRASLEEPWQQEGAKPLSRKPGAGPQEPTGLVFGGHSKCQPPGNWEQEEAPGAGSSWACLNGECCSPSSSECPRGKRQRWESRCPAEAQSPPAKVPREESGSSMDLSPIAASTIPETPSSGQVWFEWDLAQETFSSQQDHEASAWGWELRKQHRTRVYSCCRPAAGPQQKRTGTRDGAHCQAGKDKVGLGQPEEKSWPQGRRCKESYSQPEAPTALQLQGSQEERLQTVIGRLQSKRAKRPQPRQTMMVSFITELKSPSQQGQPGPTGAASAQNAHSLPEAPAHPPAQRASCLLLGERGTKKGPAKRPAPLMAKALKDYRKCFYKR